MLPGDVSAAVETVAAGFAEQVICGGATAVASAAVTSEFPAEQVYPVVE